MSPAPRVVALVPVWRAEKFLDATLDALAAQTWPQLEILISDDASPDGSAALAERRAARDPRFRLLRQPRNLGWVGNVNALLAAARGDYLLFAFQDDLPEPTYVERCVRALEANPRAIVAYSDVAIVNQDGSCETKRYGELDGIARPLDRARSIARLEGSWYIPNRGVFRASAAAAIGGLRRHGAGEFSADWPWLLHMSLLGEFVRIPEVLVTKIYLPSSLSRSWSFGVRSWSAVSLDAMRMVMGSRLRPAEKLALCAALTWVVRDRAWRSVRRALGPWLRRLGLRRAAVPAGDPGR